MQVFKPSRQRGRGLKREQIWQRMARANIDIGYMKGGGILLVSVIILILYSTVAVWPCLDFVAVTVTAGDRWQCPGVSIHSSE